MNKKGSAETIDLYIGERLKEIRKMQKLTQEFLADKIGVSFQQIQKYENGKNRISVGRLHELSRILKVPFDTFTEGFEETPKTLQQHGLSDNSQQGLEGRPQASSDNALNENYIAKKEIDEIVSVYYSLGNPKLRKSFLELGKNMAENMTDSDS